MRFIIKRSIARSAFKEMLGQANHFLITILVGLNGVRSGRVGLDPEFSTSWAPHNTIRSADRSRQFVLDLALIRAVDSVDAYMMMCRRQPRVIKDENFAKEMDGSGQRISRRLEIFCEHLGEPLPEVLSFLRLSVEWRNRMVHSLAPGNFSNKDSKILLDGDNFFRSNFSGLIIRDLLARYDAREHPSFKEAAAVIRVAHMVVELFDNKIISGMDVAEYLDEAIRLFFTGNSEGGAERACGKVWGSEKKIQKINKILMLVGVSQGVEGQGKIVPDSYVEGLYGLTANQAISRFL